MPLSPVWPSLLGRIGPGSRGWSRCRWAAESAAIRNAVHLTSQLQKNWPRKGLQRHLGLDREGFTNPLCLNREATKGEIQPSRNSPQATQGAAAPIRGRRESDGLCRIGAHPSSRGDARSQDTTAAVLRPREEDAHLRPGDGGLVVDSENFAGCRRLRDLDYCREDPLLARVVGLMRLPDVATISRTLAEMDERSVTELRGPRASGRRTGSSRAWA
jgi:hypothetical protein